jgi:hypothetical protein
MVVARERKATAGTRDDLRSKLTALKTPAAGVGYYENDP